MLHLKTRSCRSLGRTRLLRDLKEVSLRLKRREVRIEKEANGNSKRKEVLICGWVQSIMYIENEGRVCLRFNKDMLPYLTELSVQFTKYRLKAVAKMDMCKESPAATSPI